MRTMEFVFRSLAGAQGGSHLIKASNIKIPKIPILVNKAALPEHTLLLARDDLVVARAMGGGQVHAHGQKGEDRVRRWPWVWCMCHGHGAAMKEG